VIIPAANARSQQAELDNVELWSRANNLKVNPAKYAEIIFVNKRHKSTIQLLPPIQNTVPVKVIRITGVIFTYSLSVAEHIQATGP